MIEQHSYSGDYTNRYKFNGKELDEETGYYYYGARYYNPRFSIWLSVDPLAEKFPNFNPYNYVMQNPLNLTDPTGMSPEEGGGDPKKNIYVVLDYKPDEKTKADKNRDTISFEGLEENGWHGVYANNLEDAVAQVNDYLKGETADNIVLETHGGRGRGSERFVQIDNNSKDRIYTMDIYDLSLGTKTDNNEVVNDLISLTNSISSGGNLFINSCHTGENHYFAESLQSLTGDRFNVITNIGLMHREYKPGKISGHAIYDWKNLSTFNLGGNYQMDIKENGSIKHHSESGDISIVKSISLSNNGLNIKY